MKYVKLIKSSFELNYEIDYEFLDIKVKALRVVRINNLSKSYFFYIYIIYFFLKKRKFETPPKLKLKFWIYC
jgi:hypothetical protein